jgi:murein DD-endopeptidase MepM/ murein hydrolase activator NlpD
VVLPGGFATASFEEDQLHLLDDMMHAIGEQRGQRVDGWNVVGFGTHEYAHVDPRFFAPGEDLYKMMDRAKMQGPYKTRAEMLALPSSEYHIILRTERYYERMAALNNVPRAAMDVDAHDTECVVERLPNVEQTHRAVADFIDATNGGKTYGYPSVHTYWRWAFQKSPGQVMADICEWMEREYPPHYRYFAHYSWTEHNAHPFYWRDRYGVQNADEWHEEWAKRIPLGGTQPVPTPEPVAKPTTRRTEAVLSKLPQQYVNIRAQPVLDAPDLGDLAKGAHVVYYPDSPHEGWVYVEAQGVEGWVSLQGGAVAFTEPTNDEPAPPFVLASPVSFQWKVSDPFNAARPGYPAKYPGTKPLHEGIDIIPVKGEPGPYTIQAAQSGVVEKAAWQADGYGYYVKIRHDWYGETFYTIYAHMASAPLVKPGEAIIAGTDLGVMSSTGYSDGAHLHFSLVWAGKGLKNYVLDDCVDPTPYLAVQPVEEPDPPIEPPVEEPPTPEPSERELLLAELLGVLYRRYSREDKLKELVMGIEAAQEAYDRVKIEMEAEAAREREIVLKLNLLDTPPLTVLRSSAQDKEAA